MTLVGREAIQRIREILDARYENRRYRTTNAVVQMGGITRDEFGRPVKARVTIDGVPDYILPVYGFDVNEGDNIEVENIGTAAAPVYRMVGAVAGTPYSTPAIVGSMSGGWDLMNLPAIRVRSDGFIVLGGDMGEASDGTLNITGGRIEERKYGIIGYESGGKMAFALMAQDYLYQDGTTRLQLQAGDAILGQPSLGHLFVQSKSATMSWMFGDDVLFQSTLVDNHPHHFLKGLLRVADRHVGEAIELGKQPGGPFVLQMLNPNGVPMFLVRVGFEDDPGHYYLRIGRPPPSPHIELTDDGNGEPVIKIGGATLTEATLQIANLIGTIGVNNLDIEGLSERFASVSHKHDDDYVNASGDTMTGDLTMVKEGESARVILNVVSDTASNSPFFYGKRARGAIGSESNIVTDDNLFALAGLGYYGGTSPGYTNTPRAAIYMKAAEDWTGTSNLGTYLSFQLTPKGSGTISERARLLGDGTFKLRGAIVVSLTSAPADADLNNNELAMWWDQANNRVAWKGKNSSGVVKTGSLALS